MQTAEPHAELDVALPCPCCDAMFSMEEDAFPQLLHPCGHSVCDSCANAMTLVDEPVCLLCKKHIAHFDKNEGLAAFLSASALQQSSETLMSSLSSCDSVEIETKEEHPSPISVDYLRFAEKKCSASAEDLLRGVEVLQAARGRLLARKAASGASVKAAADEMKQAIDEHVRSTLETLEKEARAHVKAIDAQIDELSVSASQLLCAANMCSAASTKTVAAHVIQATHASVSKVVALAQPFTGPRVSSLVDAVVNPSKLSAAIASIARVRASVDTAATAITGAGAAWYRPAAEAAFNLSLRDHCNEPVDSLGEADIHITFSTIPEGGDVSQTAVLRVPFAVSNKGDGNFAVTYTVPESEDIGDVTIALSIAGCTADGKTTFRVRKASQNCRAEGVHVREIPVSADAYKYGFAVSPDESLMVVAEYHQGALVVYDLSDGSEVRRIKTAQSADGATATFNTPSRVCFTPSGNLLVAEYAHHRVQELTVDGRLVRSIPVRYVTSVCCNGEVIVAANCRNIGHAIEVFDYDTGNKTCSFATFGRAEGQVSSYCEGMRVTPDGKHVLVAEHSFGRLSMFTLTGVFVKTLGAGLLGDYHKDVEFGTRGEIIVADYTKNFVCVLSPDGCNVLRQWTPPVGAFEMACNPTALATNGSRLYVMGLRASRVHVYE